MVNNDLLILVTNKLIGAYNPCMIYLFGSFAWGKPQENSDIDILIIIEESDKKPHQRLKPAYIALRGLKISKDILVLTKSEYETYSKEPSTLFYKIKHEGVKLYEAA